MVPPSPLVTNPDKATGLPADWEIRVSKTRQLPYYINPKTNALRWERPANTDLAALQIYISKLNPDVDEKKIRTRHLLVKHTKSRRPVSRKQVRPRAEAGINRRS